ncbi:SIR2 family protein [Rahnella sp. FC061912-K]|uniref:SIR2 family protein n=1 Tax=Rahnella rivi TaxID=2816249 RepID=UPI001C26148A|nr:SIR2 family protein [Rahnella rivi]MBU9828440.1 SIR2 family protein [Rahnella rivi]
MAKINDDLIKDLAMKKVVLFLGSGVSSSVDLDEKDRFKGWNDFLIDAAQDREEPLKSQVNELITSRDYLLACELLQSNYAESWEKKVSDEYGRAASPSDLHKALISLKQRIVITTNFDKLIEDAWSNSLSNGERHFKVLAGINNDSFKVLKDHDTSYIIKIHGSIDDFSKVVFSRSQYIKLAFGNDSYTSFIDSLLLNYTFLYVGFSMDDPAILGIMEMYALRYSNARPHYIFTPKGVPENIQKIHRELRKLIVIPYSSENKHSELTELIKQMSLDAEVKKKEYIANFMSKI